MTSLPQTTESRGHKALAVVASGALEHPVFVGAEHRLVPSTSKNGAFYVTSLDSCTCMDATYRPGKICKHRIALKLQQVLDEAAQENGQSSLKVVA